MARALKRLWRWLTRAGAPAAPLPPADPVGVPLPDFGRCPVGLGGGWWLDPLRYLHRERDGTIAEIRGAALRPPRSRRRRAWLVQPRLSTWERLLSPGDRN